MVVNETTNDPVVVDKEKMKRVFVNIIKNAIAAMPKGGRLTISSRKSMILWKFPSQTPGWACQRRF